MCEAASLGVICSASFGWVHVFLLLCHGTWVKIPELCLHLAAQLLEAAVIDFCSVEIRMKHGSYLIAYSQQYTMV